MLERVCSVRILSLVGGRVLVVRFGAPPPGASNPRREPLALRRVPAGQYPRSSTCYQVEHGSLELRAGQARNTAGDVPAALERRGLDDGTGRNQPVRELVAMARG
jgi:hypothetical protein